MLWRLSDSQTELRSIQEMILCHFMYQTCTDTSVSVQINFICPTRWVCRFRKVKNKTVSEFLHFPLSTNFCSWSKWTLSPFVNKSEEAVRHPPQEGSSLRTLSSTKAWYRKFIFVMQCFYFETPTNLSLFYFLGVCFHGMAMNPQDSADPNYFNWDEPRRERGEGCSFSLLYIHFTLLGKCSLVHLQLFMDTSKRF